MLASVYAWNPRDQMKQATKYVNAALAGYVKYEYCLSCDGALPKRLQYNSSDELTSEKRYEYDGLNLLRVDERCDADGDGIVEAGETTWRMVEVATHRPGQLGALVGKRVYSYPTAGNRCVSNGYTVYTYGYDAVGNVVLVYTGGGDEAFFFAQDAFGNELDIAAFSGYDWDSARDDGVGEHQTGKWIDPFTGQYYFWARWYDSVVGRFTGRDVISKIGGADYSQPGNNPLLWPDPDGRGCCSDSSEVEYTYDWEPPKKPCCPTITELSSLMMRLKRSREVKTYLCDRGQKPQGEPYPPLPNPVINPDNEPGPFRTQCLPAWLGFGTKVETRTNLTWWNTLSGCLQECMLAWENAVRGFCLEKGWLYLYSNPMEAECAGAKAEVKCLEQLIWERVGLD